MFLHVAAAASVLFASSAHAFSVEGNWTQLPHNPYGKAEWHSVVTTGGHIYTMGGNDNSTDHFDVRTGQWGRLDAKFPSNSRVSKIVATDADMIGGNIFLFGGKQSNSIQENDNWLYAMTPNAVSEEWSWGKDWNTVATSGEHGLPAARDGHSSTHCEGRIWIYGGWNEKKYFKDLWFIAPRPGPQVMGSAHPNWAGTWHQVGEESGAGSTGLHVQWPSERNSHSIVAYGGYLVMFGGFSHDTKDGTVPWVQCQENKNDEGCQFFNDVWKFDVQGLIWTQVEIQADAKGIKTTPTGRARHAASVLGTGMFVFGGAVMPTKNVRATGELWRFDLELNTWNMMDQNAKPSLSFGMVHPGPRSQMQMVTIAGSLYVYGGNNGSIANDLWKYTPKNLLNKDEQEEAENGALTAWLVVFIILTILASSYICFMKGACARCTGGNSGYNRGPASGSAELGGAYGYQSQS